MTGRVPPLAGLLAAAALLLAAAGPAAAHVTGVFLHFLKDMEEPTYSTAFLRRQVEQTEQRLAAVVPEVAEAQALYEEAAGPAAARLQFYDAYAGQAFGSLWSGAEDLVDVLANLRLMARLIQQDVAALEETARRYAQLRLKQDTLQRYRDLLDAVETAAQARERRLGGAVNRDELQLALYDVAEDWERLRPHLFVPFFQEAGRRLQRLDRVAVPGREPGTWHLEEDALNRVLPDPFTARVEGGRLSLTGPRFYLRADHLYFDAVMEGAFGTYHVLAVGQMERAGPTRIQYRIEAIYIDGLPVDPGDPDVQADIYQNSLLAMDGRSLLPGAVAMRYEQNNGYLWLAPEPPEAN